MSSTVKICWFGIYDKDYPRNAVFLEGLAELDVTVKQCQVHPSESWRFFKLARKFRQIRDDIDVVYVGFPSQIAVLLAKLLTRKPVVMDAMSSAYEGVVYVRSQHNPYHPKALKLLLLDWLAAIVVDLIITDTNQHTTYWASWFLVDPKKVCSVPIGSSVQHFYPLDVEHKEFRKKLLVQYHGSYIRVQGLDVIVDAIALLKDEPDIAFRFIGSGEEYDYVYERVQACCQDRVAFVGRVPFTEINAYVNEADVILGLFGEAKRADRAVANKVYEGVAARRAVITKDTPAVREAFGNNAVVLVDRDPQKIADAIVMLKDEVLRARYAEAGYEVFVKHYTPRKVTEKLLLSIKQNLKV